jgi:uncharacterized protein (TIGR02145 family)
MIVFMKRILFLIAIFPALTANAQDYFISFGGTGASNTVDSVKVENLFTGTSLTLKVNEILHLRGTVGIPSSEYDKPVKLKIYPNPMKGNSIIEISPSVAGDAIITVFDMTGRQLSQTQNYLDKSKQELRLSGLKDGFYLINVRGNNYQYSGKLLCTGQSDGTLSIEKVSENNEVNDEKTSETGNKGGQDNVVGFAVSSGDALSYTGYSGKAVGVGIYGTVVTTGIPSQDSTIIFNFIPCSDGVNDYLTVKINTQIWMAENLKTTKYNDGTAITKIAGSEPITEAYTYYNNDISNLNIYGALYNWYAVNTGKLCPTGWHVPNKAEWSILSDFLGGLLIAGGKMKETGYKHWLAPNTGATNKSGFGGLPGGIGTTTFGDKGTWAYFWSSNEYDNSWSYFCELYNTGTVGGIAGATLKERGMSVRCLKDN